MYAVYLLDMTNTSAPGVAC